MSAGAGAAIDWGRTIRLLAALRLGSAWREGATLIVLLGILMLGNLLALNSAARPAISSSGLMLAMLTYFLFAWTGSANAAWRVLPVSRIERKTAAWLLVSALPLLASLVSCLLAAAALALAGQAIDIDHMLALIGFQGLLTQGMALAAILIGDWPEALGRFMVVSERRRSDWLMMSIMMVLVLAGAFLGSQLAAPRGLGAMSCVIALYASAALLPLTRRFARLDPAPASTRSERPAWSDRLRLGGWSGHFLVETARSLASGALVLIGLAFMSAFPFSRLPRGGPGDEPLRMFEAFSSSGFGPAMLSVFTVLIGLQFLMRHRRLLLTLPRGERLLMMTPAYNALLTFLPVALVLIPREPGGWGLWLAHIATGLLVSLALGYACLASMLRATTTAQVLVSGGVLALPISVLLVLALIVRDVPGTAAAVNLGASAAAAIVLLASLMVCLRQLRFSRNPYRAWPFAAVRWNGG